MSTVIGIDLGTTCSCVSVFKKGKLEVFENDHGLRTTPSYVAFSEFDCIIGNEAKIHTTVDPVNTVYDAKRLIGRKFTEKVVQQDLKQWPFAVFNDKGKSTIKVNYENKEKCLLPEEISAMILRRLREIAEEKLGESVTRAVITVPAYFTDTQRQATKDAATIAGLNVTRLINEPTAAAIAFTLNKKDDGKRNVLVYDLGGGTFDVSVLTIENGNIEVKAVNGDTHLGGRDFDNKIVDYFVAEILKKHNVDLTDEQYTRSLARLRHASEGVKIVLSAKNRIQAKLEVAALFDGKDYCSSITKAKFEEICDDLMRSTLIPVEKALKDAKFETKNIDEILLVGGSTRITKIQKLVEDFFKGKSVNKSINPEEAVACGAAIQAALLQGEKDETIAGIYLKDVTALSYGVGINGGIMSVIIPRNSPYPNKLSRTYRTLYDNQKNILIQVYQGEREMIADNHFLGDFKIDNLPKKKAGKVSVEETMEIDENGLLVVTAVEKSTGVTANITISNAMERLSDEKIKQLLTEAESMKKADLKEKQRIEAKNELEKLIYDIRRSVDEDNSLRQRHKRRLENVVEQMQEWVELNSDASEEEFNIKINELKRQQNLLSITTTAFDIGFKFFESFLFKK